MHYTHWQADIPLALEGLIYELTESTALNAELLGTAALWPLHRSLQANDPNAIAALQQAIPQHYPAILRHVNRWELHKIDAVKRNVELAQHDAELAQAFKAIVEHFKAQDIFLEQLGVCADLSRVSAFEIREIKAALVNVGGTQTIGQVNLILPQDPEKRKQHLLREQNNLLRLIPTEFVPEPSIEQLSGALHAMPLANPRFRGRDQDLQQIANLIKQHAKLIVCSGLLGIGKSTLASEFVRRYGHYFYKGVYWLRCEGPEQFKQELANLGLSLGLFDEFSMLSVEQKIKQVKKELEEPNPRLLVIDNCDHLKETQCRDFVEKYIPSIGGTRVLITSSSAKWRADIDIVHYPLQALSQADSIALLADLVGPSAAAAIVAQFGGIPLALNAVANFAKRYQGNPLLTQLANSLQQKQLRHACFSLGDFQVFRLIEGILAELDPLAVELLRDASLYPQIANTELQAQFAKGDGEREMQYIDLIGLLCERGLIEQQDQALSVHRLVAAYFRM